MGAVPVKQCLSRNPLELRIEKAMKKPLLIKVSIIIVLVVIVVAGIILMTNNVRCVPPCI
jgi:hypothetical protein